MTIPHYNDTFTADAVFPSGSAIREINRETALLLTGGRVLLMQIAHPMVAASVANHSYVFRQPLKRLYRTLDLTLTLVYGTPAEVQHALDEIAAAHRPATGRLSQAVGKHPAGATYNPRNPRQALWVFATLVEGAISGYEHLVAPLDETTKEAFYVDSTQVAGWMGIRESYLPTNYAGLLTYIREAIASGEVAVSDDARRIAPFIMAQSTPVVNVAMYPLYRFSVGLLPEAIREQFGYEVRSWEASLINGTCRLSRTLVPHLPGILRYMPHYRRAQRR